VVVPLPLLARGARGWLGFLCGRLLRLYVPVWGAILLSGVLLWLVPRPASVVTQGSWVERTNATTAKVGLLFSEAGLMRNSFSTDSVLWSLRWEIIFSVALPLFLLLAILLRRFWVPVIIACAGLTLVGKITNIDALLYLPVFFAGTLISVNLGAIRAWAAGPSRLATAMRRSSIAVVVVAVSALLIVASWMFRPLIPAGTLASDALGSLTPLGAVGVVLCAIILSPVRGALSMRGPQWLGRISFSLYLTHLPILVALVYVFGDRNWGLVALVGIPISLGFAYLYFRFVEAPSHRLARRVTRLADRVFQR
jgi:peptidoglycan/LPS O-acetylase OafA/YrhL